MDLNEEIFGYNIIASFDLRLPLPLACLSGYCSRNNEKKRKKNRDRIMENVVLLAIDGSQGSERALEHVKNRAKKSGAKVVVAYVIEWSPYSFNTPEENAERHSRRESEIERAHSGVVDPAVEYLKKCGVSCESTVRHGRPAETIIEVAEEFGAAQIVIGRRGQTGLKTLLFGSVAGNLIQTAPVPVMVVP